MHGKTMNLHWHPVIWLKYGKYLMHTCTIISHQPRCPRSGRWDTGWRTLPVVLLERPLGGAWEIDLDGLPTMRVESGSLAVIPRGWRHRLRLREDGPGMTSCWCYLRWVDDAGLDWPLPSRPLLLDGRHGALIDALHPGAGGWRDTARVQRAGWRLMEVIALRQEAPPAQADGRIRDLLVWLQAHLHEPLTRDDLAARAGCSPTRLHDLCVGALGLAPMRLLAGRRVARAQELLLGSTLAMGAIAERCGYASPFWFSRAFRAATGQTPTAYRAAHRAAHPRSG